MSGFHLATGAAQPDTPPEKPKPRFHPVLGYQKPEEKR